MTRALLMGIVERKGMELSGEQLDLMDSLGELQMYVDYKEQVHEVIEGKKYVSDKWEVALCYKGKDLELDYTQGSGWYGETPIVTNVLYSLLSDYHGYKDSTSFEDYCDIYGMEKWEEFESVEDMDEDGDGRNKKSLAIYELVEKQAEQIEDMFTPEELALLNIIYQDY